ncbi:MAG: hypothetical protein WCO40_06890 [Thermoleophilia bacterium]
MVAGESVGMIFNKTPRVSYASVTATLALFLSVGGVSYAATALPRDSVGTPQLRDGAVDSAKIKDGALQYEDFGFGQIPAGLAGPRGPKGERGARGPKGAKGVTGAKGETGAGSATSVVVRSSEAVQLTGLVASVTVASCVAGERAVGGGFDVTPNNRFVRVMRSAPTAAAGAVPTDWEVEALSDASGDYPFVTATVICAKP